MQARTTADLLRDSRFRRLWFAGGLDAMVRWLDILVLGVFTFEMTDSASKVALIFFVLMVPRLFFGVPLGGVVDRVNRKRFLALSQALIAVTFAVVGFLILTDIIRYWHLAVVVFIGGTGWAAEFTVRRALLADLVPDHALGRAFGLDFATNSATRMIGPALGGGLFVTVGAEGAYFLAAVLLTIATLVTTTIPYTPQLRARAGATWADLAEGIRYIRARDLLIAVLVVTVVFNLVYSPYLSFVPVIGKDILNVDAFRVGLLSTFEGFGAAVGALWIANRARPGLYTRIYFFGTALFLICALVFSQSDSYILAAPVLFIAGIGMGSFATMQTTILVAGSAPEMRGRVLGALSLSIGAGPLSTLQVSALVGVMGTQAALAVIILEGAVALLLAGLWWPLLRRRHTMPPLDPTAEPLVDPTTDPPIDPAIDPA